MKKIIILAILALATLSHAWESKTEYRNASGDKAYVIPDASTGHILIQNPGELAGLEPVRSSATDGRPTLDHGLNLGLTPTVGAHGGSGKIYWDSTWKTGVIELEDDVNLQIGQETVAYVYNGTGSTLTQGQAVYVSGTQSGVPSVSLAKGDAEATSKVIGLITSTSIPTGEYGYVTRFGNVNILNTDAWALNDELYLSADTAGEMTNVRPYVGDFDTRIGRVMLKDPTNGRVHVNIIRDYSIPDVESAAGKGIELFPDDTTITASGTESTYQIKTLSNYPVTTAEDIDTISMTNNTVLYGTYKNTDPIGRTTIAGGVWSFDIWTGVSSAVNVTSITQNINRVRPGTGTVTTTGTGTTRTAVASEGTPFATAAIDVGGTIDTDSFLETTTGYFRIVSRVSDSEITVTTPTTYTNQSDVAFSVHKRLFSVSTGEMNNLVSMPAGTGLQKYTIDSAQGSFTVEATDTLASAFFGISTGTRSAYFSHNGTERYSHIVTALTTDHSDLGGLTWTGSGHTGTAGGIAGFDGSGDAVDLAIGADVQAYSTNLAELAAVNPVADALTRLTLSNAELGATLGTSKVTQTVSVDNEGTLTPTSGYDYVRILLTANASPTYITFEEPTTQAETGDEIEIFNVDESYAVFNDTAGKLELPGRTTLKQGGKIRATYIVDRYYGFPSGSMEEYVSAINLCGDSTGGGTIQGLKKVVNNASGDVDIVSSSHDYRDGEIWFTSSGNLVSKTGYELAGTTYRVGKLTTAEVSIYSDNANTDVILKAGTNIGEHKATLAAAFGSWATVLFTANNELRIIAQDGTVTDGGAVADICSLFDSYEVSGTNSFAVAYSAATRVYVGTTITPDASTDICKVGFICDSVSGTISSYDYYFRLYDMESDPATSIDLETVLGTSAKIDGGDISAGSWIEASFSADITTSGTYALVLYAVANDAGADGTRIYNSSNFMVCRLTTDTDSGDMTGGKIATDGLQRWGTDGVRSYYDANDDILVRVYGALTP